MKSNDLWPQGFGFTIGGKAPVVILSVQDNSVAQRAGLHPGDQILELNGENVQGLNKEQIILLAKRSMRIPPAIAVISRIRTFDLRRRRGRFGFTLRGKGPVYVYDVENKSPAYNVGMRSGDLVLKIDGVNVRHANADQVQQIVEACGPTISVVLIAGSHSITDKSSSSTSSRYRQARDFYVQMNYYLPADNAKKAQLIKALNRYARDRSVEQLCRLLLGILETPIERKLLKEIRCLIPKKHKPQYDVLVGINADRMVPRRPQSAISFDSMSRQSSLDDFDLMTDNGLFRTWSSGSSMQSQYSQIMDQKRKVQAQSPRTVRVKRGSGSGFGFTLSGDTPVFVKSVDKGGPADFAKLKPGDHILEINGLNVRGKKHGTVVELLKGSGTYPSLLVQWRPLSTLRHHGSSASSISSRSGLSVTFDRTGEDSIHRLASTSSRASSTRGGSQGSDRHHVRSLSREFKFEMNRLFTNGEQQYIKQCLTEYKHDRNIAKLLEGIEPVLDDPAKLSILHYMSGLLPDSEQTEFDRAAARIFAKQSDEGVMSSLNTTDRDVMDVLYRVQGMRLTDTPRERTIIGGSAMTPESPDHWPARGSVSHWNSSSRSDLDTIPVRDSNVSEVDDVNDEDEELDLGLEELADALLEEDRKKASQMNVKVDVHGTKRQVNGATQGQISHSSIEVVEEGPSREALQHDLNNKAKQLDLANKVISEQQKIIAETIPGEGKDSGSEPSKQSFPNDLAAAVKSRNKDQENDDTPSSSSAPPPPPPPPNSAVPPPPPPPPPPGPPPPPVPMIGGALSADGSNMTLKRVNWEKLSDVGLENTVWAQLGRNDPLDNVIEFMELEQNFSTIKTKQEKPSKKDEKPNVLDRKKLYNISILLGHLKTPVSEIKSFILSMDDSKLCEAHIKQLLLYAPDTKELQKYKYVTPDSVQKMEKADQFSYEMSKIPYYTQRLKAMLFRSQFDDKFDEIKPDLEAVIDASKELRTSEKLHKLLELVLLTGNYMNKGNTRIAGAQGFKISYLTKLNSTKTTDNKSTLLNFLVQKIETKCPEVLTIKQDLKTVPVAAKVSGQMVATEIQDLSRRMKTLQDDLISFQARNVQDEDDHFIEVVIDIIEQTEGKLEELLSLQKTMNNEFKQTVTFFGEKLSKTSTEDFFAVFAAFLAHYEVAINHNATKKKLKEEQAKREERSKLFRELKQRSLSVNEEEDTAKVELKKSLDDRKAKVIPYVLQSAGNETKSKINGTKRTDDAEFHARSYSALASSQKKQVQSKFEEQVKPAVSAKPVASAKPSETIKPAVPTKVVVAAKPVASTKPVAFPKPVASAKPVALAKPTETIKPAVPVKPEIAKKPQAPPPKPKPYALHLAQNKNDSNNNLNKNNQLNINKGSPEETSPSRVIDIEPREEESRKIPHGFRNILSSFESNVKEENPLDVMYAKPDMSKKTPKQLKPIEKVPATPPRSNEMNHVEELNPPTPPQVQEDISSSYTDPGPPSFKPPPPPLSLENQEDARHASHTASELPKAEPKQALPNGGSLPPPSEFMAGSSRYAGLGLDDDSKDNQNSLSVTPAVDLSYSSVDVVTSIPQKPVDYLDYEDVEPRFMKITPPPKPLPYKGKIQAVTMDKQFGSTITGSTADGQHDESKDDEFVLGSPRQPIAGSGSLRLSSAQLVANALKAPIPSKLKNLSDSQGIDTSMSKRYNPSSPSVSSRLSHTSIGSPQKPKPPPPPRSTSIKDLTKDETEADIDRIIARALSPEMKPKFELDDIPVRDTNFSPKSNTRDLDDKVFEVDSYKGSFADQLPVQQDSNLFTVVPPPSWHDTHDVPPLDLSEFDLESSITPPPPPSDPPPSLPIHTYVNLDMPSHDIDGLVNGCKEVSDDEDSVPPPPLPPSDKYGTLDERITDEMMKPLVPPLRKLR